MDINELTVGQAKELASIFGATGTQETIKSMLGVKCIIRTYSAGVWFGEIAEKCGEEVIVKNARRMWRWCAAESISLSAVATHGIKHDRSKICEAVERIWLKSIEIIPCASKAITSIEGAKNAEAE